MTQAVMRSRPLRRWERFRLKMRRRFDKYRANVAVGIAFAIASIAAIAVASYLFQGR
jgi:hypothetical protein